MSDSRTRIWFSLFVLAVFAIGFATGMFIERRIGPPPRDGGPAFGRGPGPGGPPPGRLIERLNDVLQLTPEQRGRIEGIFEARRKQLEAVQDDVIARAEREQRELQSEIRGVLTPEQQQRFDKWLAESPRGRRGRPGGSGMGPFGPGRGRQ